MEDDVDVRQAEAELPLHVLFIEGHLALDVLQGGEVLFEQAEPPLGDLQVLARQVLADAQGVEQLQPHPLLLVQGADDIALQGVEAAANEEGVVAGLLGPQGQPGRHGEDLGRGAQEGPRVPGHELHHVDDVLFRLQDVDLVDHHHDLLPPVADALKEGALALGERAVGGGDEEDHVRAGDELARDRLVLAVDGVGAGRVDDVDVAQQLHRRGDDVERRLQGDAVHGRAVLDDVDAGGGGGDPLFEHPASQEGVDEGALAGVELAGDDQEEQLVELQGGPLEGLLVLGRGVEPRQGLLEVGQQPAVLRQQLVLIFVEDTPQHGGPPARGRT